MSFLSWLWHLAHELWWAFIFAVLVALYFESRRGKNFVRRLFFSCADIYKRIAPDRNLLKQEVDRAIKSNCDNVPKKFVTRKRSINRIFSGHLNCVIVSRLLHSRRLVQLCLSFRLVGMEIINGAIFS